MLVLIILAASIALNSAQKCNTGGIYSTQLNRCYQYFTAPAQFEFAEEQCALLGGHLASIQNGAENALLQSNAANAFKKSNYSDYWIGGNDLETSGTWKWTDPSVTWNYQNWQLGEPQQGSDCVIQDKGDGTWSAIGCTSYRPYVCVTPVIVTATCPPITTPKHIASCGIKEGKYENLAWIGMHQVGSDWIWTDGTPSDYINWAPKQPDNPGKELCVQTAPDVSHDSWYENWNNLACNTVMRAYICKKASIK